MTGQIRDLAKINSKVGGTMSPLDKMSKETLIQKILKLEDIIEILEEEKKQNELFEFPWIGNLGQWHWRPQNNQVVFNEKKVSSLGYTEEECGDEVGFEFFTSKLHPEDYGPVMKNMRQHLMGETPAYEVEYRIQSKEGHYLWYYDRGIVVKRDSAGNPLLVSGIVFDISESKKIEQDLKDMNAQLKELSISDYLTGAYNRRYFFEVLEKEVARSKRTQSKFSLIMADIDDFKKINDTYGHTIGDSVLIELVQLVHNRIRKSDVFARWGGEEFMMLLFETSAEAATDFAKELCDSVSSHTFKDVGQVTASFGVVTLDRQDSAKMIISEVDNKMYLAKRNGKNQVVV